MNKIDVQKLADCCKNKLDLASAVLPDEYFYQSLPLCVIDAVWSIGVRYEGVQNVVKHYCEHFGHTEFRDNRKIVPDKGSQTTISSFISEYGNCEDEDVDNFTDNIYKNKQKVLPEGRVPKSKAVLEFAQILKRHNVECLQDVVSVVNDGRFESAIKSIRGHGTGLSLSYFLMLSGSEDHIKADRWILRFIKDCLDRNVLHIYAEPLLRAVVDVLKPEFPHLTPRLLDYCIWLYQRASGKTKKESASSFIPKQFKAYIGGYFGTSFSIRLKSGGLIYQASCCSENTQEQPETYKPSVDDWKQFWATLEEVSAWTWNPRYSQPACDGTNWSIEIIQADRTLRSSGSNAYPPDGGFDRTSEFDAFCKAVSRLVGGKDFR